MRKLRKNDKWLYYANLEETKTEYLTGEDGYEKTVIVNGEARLIETGVKTRVFGAPVRFLGHITPTGIETYAHGNESYPMAQGIDTSAYDGFLSTMAPDVPLTEESLIWEVTEPAYKADGTPDEHSADWIISRVAKTLNYAVYLLKAVPK